MLSVQTLINVTTSLSQTAGSSQTTNTLLCMTENTVIDLVTRLLPFYSLTSVASFFGEGGDEYAAAVVFFGQSPTPTGPFYVGRWANVAAAGQLLGSALTAAQQALSNFNTIGDGGFSITFDGGSVEHVGTIVLTGVASLNAVATAINAQMTGGTIAWNANLQRFQITSATTGSTSAVTFLTAPSSGPTDISGLLGMQSTQGGYTAAGQAAETALAAVTLMETNFGGKWYALMVPQAAASDHLAIGPFIQATQRKHFYQVTTQDPNVLVPSSTTDVAYELAQLSLTKTAVMYSSTSPVAGASPMALILGVNYSGTATAINLMWQTCPTLTPENLNATQLAALAAKNCNVYALCDNGSSIFLTGTTCTTDVFIDTVIGADNLAITMTTALFNSFLGAGTKIAQDDAGMHVLVSTCTNVMVQYLTNDYLAPGTWTGAGIPPVLATGDFLENGFIVYAPPLATQPQSQRAQRMAGPIQIAAKLAGAINTANVAVTINP
jgi:hypothetical protein